MAQLQPQVYESAVTFVDEERKRVSPILGGLDGVGIEGKLATRITSAEGIRIERIRRFNGIKWVFQREWFV